MSLRFSATVDARNFDIEFGIATGETVAVLGPNGAGKSTLIALLSGLLRPDSGSAYLDDEVLFASPRTMTAPYARSVSVLDQDPLLFPHLDVAANVAFGPRSAGVARRMARARAQEWLRAVGAESLADRRAHELSGGEAQRVAIARALAREPRLLLLDEPMAALDITVSPMIRATLREVLRDRTTIIVTHDPLDALILADRVIVLESGRIVEDGDTRQVLTRPRTSFAAAIGGLVLLKGICTSTGIRLADGTDLDAADLDDSEPGTGVAACIRPTAVTISKAVAAPRSNAIRSLVTQVEPRGDLVRVRSGVVHADMSPADFAEADIAVGEEVAFGLPASALSVYGSTASY